MGVIKHQPQLLPPMFRVSSQRWAISWALQLLASFPSLAQASRVPQSVMPSGGQWEDHRLSVSTSERHSQDKSRKERNALQLQWQKSSSKFNSIRTALRWHFNVSDLMLHVIFVMKLEQTKINTVLIKWTKHQVAHRSQKANVNRNHHPAEHFYLGSVTHRKMLKIYLSGQIQKTTNDQTANTTLFIKSTNDKV